MNWLKWVSVVKGRGNEMKVLTKDLPFDMYPVKPPMETVLEPVWQRAEELGIITLREGRVVWA